MISHSRQQMLKELAAGRSGRSGSPLIKPGSEDEIQANFFAWVDLHKGKFPELNLVFAVPNVGSYARAQNAKLKLTGRRPGVPDVCLPCGGHGGRAIAGDIPQSRYRGLWIEFKKPKEKPRPEQNDWHMRLIAVGHRVEVCTSWTDAANIVIEYLALPLQKL